MRSELAGSCMVHWTTKWLSQNTFGFHNLAPKHLNHHLQRITTEMLHQCAPYGENSVSCSSLLHLLDRLLSYPGFKGWELSAKVFSHLQKHCQKMLSNKMTTSIEPLACIPLYGNFFILSEDYIIWKLSFYDLQS